MLLGVHIDILYGCYMVHILVCMQYGRYIGINLGVSISLFPVFLFLYFATSSLVNKRCIYKYPTWLLYMGCFIRESMW